MQRILILFFIFSTNVCQATITPKSVKVSFQLSPNEDAKLHSYHLVGNFNNWSLSEPDSIPLTLKSGKLVTSLTVHEQPLFFTVVKNRNWQQLPATLAGKSICTFMYNPKQDAMALNIHLRNWKNDKIQESLSSTISGNVQFHKNFDMPLLKRKTNISVYLPPSYQKNLSQKYPVLYMLDGQNLFDASRAYSDEWKIDEILEQLTPAGKLPEIIVVGIDNGPKRWSEYNAWDFIGSSGKNNQALGEYTVSFIKENLKPFIDKTYRTRRKAESTGFSGSSLGGLMSLYVAMEHAETFGFVAAFSPSLAVKNSANQSVLETALNALTSKITAKIYLDMGEMEYGDYKAINSLHKMLLENVTSKENIKLVKDKLGRHCELDWSKRFPNAIDWLLANEASQK